MNLKTFSRIRILGPVVAASLVMLTTVHGEQDPASSKNQKEARQKIESVGREDVVQAESDDKEMNAAMKKARDTLLTFFNVLEKRDKDKRYLLKVRIEEDGEVEHVWLEPVKRQESGIIGMLANKPVSIKKHKVGDVIAPLPDEVSDWAILSKDGTYEGGYTIKLMEKRVKAREQKDKKPGDPSQGGK